MVGNVAGRNEAHSEPITECLILLVGEAGFEPDICIDIIMKTA
jgi:hypothetical protein